MKNFEFITNLITEDPGIACEVIEIFCGKYLGSGSTRDVFEFNFDPKWVVKIENEHSEGDNWAEWRVWQTVAYTTDGTKDWFAPCGWISSGGRVMLQRKTKPLHTKHDSKYPEKIPAYFTDIKEENFGWIGKNFVCHDYSMCIERWGYFALNKKMQKFIK